MKNLLTIDLEDWYQGHFYQNKIKTSDWDCMKSNLEEDASLFLSILKQRNVKATFFILAYNVKRHPRLIRMIKEEGHELALHGYYHNLVYRYTPSEFEKEIYYSKKLIEDACQARVVGFRAPAWSITSSCLWALDVLIKLGFLYDSSMTESVFSKNNKSIPAGILELPRTTLKILGGGIPFAGGFFLRAYPYLMTKYLIKRENNNGRKTIVYIHPWEFSDGHFMIKPDFPKGRINDFNRHSTKRKLEALLEDFKFGPIKELIFDKA